jgi:hypothetical protein
MHPQNVLPGVCSWTTAKTTILIYLAFRRAMMEEA